MADRRNPKLSAVPPAHGGRRLGDAPAAAEQGWWPALLLALLTATVATIALISQQLTVSRVSSAAPDEGFYWTIAQYQIAHHRLKQELRAIAAGEPARQEELTRRIAVLSSKASILTEPSEVKSLLGAVPGYLDATGRLAELQRRIGPTLDKVPFVHADAVQVLAEFDAIGDDDLLSQLANDVRLSEIGAKEAVLRNLTHRIQWVWAGFALCWTTLALWLVYAIRSRRRYRAAARDRQRAVEAMEQALSAKRKFLSMVNHEVRSPLQNIVASAELLALQNPRPESVAAIRRIRHAVTVLQGQLRDLLTLAHGEAGQLATQAETFDLCELVHDVCADQEEAAHAKGLTFHVIAPADPMTIHADPIRIAQVLRNLVENAVRYTGAGRIDVRLEPFEATGPSATTGQVRLVVQDSGPGLPPQALERLQGQSVPFESSDDGTGIGLFVIRDVLQQLNGRIDVQSAESQGTTFVVTVPATSIQDTATEPVAFSVLNVLIVDDRDDVLLALSEVAHHLGHVCTTSNSAAKALGLLANQSYDVVMIDLEMPGQDGLFLATEIRQGIGPNTHSMLILISAAENQGVGQRWPFDGFMQKPIDGTALSRLIGSRKPH